MLWCNLPATNGFEAQVCVCVKFICLFVCVVSEWEREKYRHSVASLLMMHKSWQETFCLEMVWSLKTALETSYCHHIDYWEYLFACRCCSSPLGIQNTLTLQQWMYPSWYPKNALLLTRAHRKLWREKGAIWDTDHVIHYIPKGLFLRVLN